MPLPLTTILPRPTGLTNEIPERNFIFVARELKLNSLEQKFNLLQARLNQIQAGIEKISLQTAKRSRNPR
jgi:hypothetical protein